MRLLPLALMLALATVLLGCPARLPSGATALDKIIVDGTSEVDEDDVLTAMASDPTHKVLGLVRMWWMDYGVYDKTTLDKDMKRIERYYQARGFYEARVRAGRVLFIGERSVRVQVILEEGPKVLVDKVQVTGIDKLPEITRKRFIAAFRLVPGDAFDEELYRASAADSERVLTDEGYAYGSVKIGGDVDLVKHLAVVHVEVTPGPECTFGEVKIVGLRELPEDKIRRILSIEPGDKYSTKMMRAAQNALFELGVFDSLNFEPDLSIPNRTSVPIVVNVTESKLRRVKAGPGFLIDPLRNDLHLVASWENRNIFGGLRFFKYELRPLLMFKPGFLSAKYIRPGFTTSADFRQPSFIEKRLSAIVGASTGIIPDPVNDFRNFSTRASVGVDRRFGALIYGGLFYRKGWDIPTPYPGFELPASVFKATIGYFELLSSVDTRDDLVRPTRGYYASMSLQYAMENAGFFGGDFGDVRVQPEIRLFGSVAKGVVLAFRFTTGFLMPRNYEVREPTRRAPTSYDASTFADDRSPNSGATPIWRAFFSGGANSNRGYPTRAIGIRDCLSTDGVPERGIDCSVYVGGATLWEGSLELRFNIAGDLSGVLFVDGSDVSRRRFDIRLDFPHLSTGPGLRYQTPVGPIRLDFGWRIPGLQRIGGALDVRETPRDFSLGFKGPFALHLSIGEAF